MNKTKEKIIENKAITLIALVVTIIILIILAGVSINLVVGKDGIINKAKMAKEMTEKASEEEIIRLKLLDDIMEGNSIQIGKELFDKTIENGNKWNIIILKENNQTYGTDWIYIEKETNIENYGDTKYNWLSNKTTGEMIKLEEDSFVELSYNSSVGSTEGLIFNLDPSIIEGADESNIEEKLGKDVELINFDWNENSGLTKTSFNIDGVNDYIKIKYDNVEEKQILADNGFSFEFYGILDEGTSYNEKNEIIDYGYKGWFCYWNGIESNMSALRFGLNGIKNKTIYWNAGFGDYQSDYSNPKSIHNINYPNIIEDRKEYYISITLDTSNIIEKDGEEYYKQTLYINGEKVCEGNYNKKSWDTFINNDLNSLQYFCIGRSSLGKNGWWHYSKMNAYAMRLYNRGLSEEEVKNNYDKSVAYHESLM